MKDPYIPAVFVSRQNRFVGTATIGKKNEAIYIPNTGRLSELLIPGSPVLLRPYDGKFRYKLQIVIYKDRPVFIDSIESNMIFMRLLKENRVPGLERFSFVRREPGYQSHRFDFSVMDDSGKEMFIELKSCTLAWKNCAAFPDAPTERGVAHLKALAESKRGTLVFLVFHCNVSCFVPDYHTHFEFYSTLRAVRNKINILAFAAGYDENLEARSLKPVPVRIPEMKPKGAYLLLYKNETNFTSTVGSMGSMAFPPGYYLYAGSGRNNLFKRIDYHKKKRVKKRYHLDYIKIHMKLLRDFPIVTNEDIECRLARKTKDLSFSSLDGIGSSDCACPAHLFYSKDNPMEKEEFWDMLLELRFGSFNK